MFTFINTHLFRSENLANQIYLNLRNNPAVPQRADNNYRAKHNTIYVHLYNISRHVSAHL